MKNQMKALEISENLAKLRNKLLKLVKTLVNLVTLEIHRKQTTTKFKVKTLNLEILMEPKKKMTLHK